jgi:hypothetical protein
LGSSVGNKQYRKGKIRGPISKRTFLHMYFIFVENKARKIEDIVRRIGK